MVSVPRRGFVVFLLTIEFYPVRRILGFSPPKGIRCFSTLGGEKCLLGEIQVSVPRRGFVVFLRVRWILPCFRPECQVSVPRRGFVVFLRRPHPHQRFSQNLRFSPPKGIRCFSTWEERDQEIKRFATFQSPEGDSLFFYACLDRFGIAQLTTFQSPEGDSLFFYGVYLIVTDKDGNVFQSPEGDSLFFYPA